MAEKLYFIIGGERSGKSRFATELAEGLTSEPCYVATARIWDEEFRHRVQRHTAERGPKWTTFEEDKRISSLPLEGKVALIDCVTLWLTNYFVDNENDVRRSLEQAKAEFTRLAEKEATLIVVSNEIGMGGHATTEVGRKFTELQGWMNQEIARHADVVVLMVSGIHLVVKGAI